MTKAFLAFGVALAGAASVGAVQNPPAPGNPRAGDAVAVRAGAGLFRERCAECHGADAKGVTGHDLTRLWASGATD